MISVVVPAHDEEARIASCLHALLADAAPGELDVVVVCNGCTDVTAPRARAVRDGLPAGLRDAIRVHEIPVASKAAALNAGDAAALDFPRFYVDADVLIRTADLRAAADVLDRGKALLVAPTPRYLLDGVSRPAAAYQRFWQRLPAVAGGTIGAGVYGLSEEGRRRVGRFPDLIGDDFYVQETFAVHERRVVPDAFSHVRPPASLRAIVRRKRRVYAGNHLVASHTGTTASRPSGWLRVLRREPATLRWLPVYLLVSVTARITARGADASPVPWGRDHTSR